MPDIKHILLVEDDPNDVELIMTGLVDNNLAQRVVIVRDGEEALDYLNYRGKFADRAGGDPVVVLLDLKLPKINGLEVLRQVKSDEKLRCLPVVILTSSKEDQDIVEGYKQCRNDHSEESSVKPASQVKPEMFSSETCFRTRLSPSTA